MADYWMTRYFLAVFGWAYVLVCCVAIALALWFPSRKTGKLAAAAIVLVLAAVLPFQGYQQYVRDEAAREAFRERHAKAKLLFDSHCKEAGEKIYRTVFGVKGFRLLKLRPEQHNFQDKYMVDPYGYDYSGETFVASMLWGRHPAGYLQSTSRQNAPFKYVVYPASDGKGWLQAELSEIVGPSGAIKLKVQPAKDSPRYGVEWSEVSSAEDREYWVAGSKLQVLDLQTGEVLAERVGWIMDPGQGSKSGGRSAWLLAARQACPPFPMLHGVYPQQAGQTREFVENVLYP